MLIRMLILIILNYLSWIYLALDISKTSLPRDQPLLWFLCTLVYAGHHFCGFWMAQRHHSCLSTAA